MLLVAGLGNICLEGAARAAPLGRSEFGRASPHAKE
jgi:hypothetical protein